MTLKQHLRNAYSEYYFLRGGTGTVGGFVDSVVGEFTPKLDTVKLIAFYKARIAELSETMFKTKLCPKCGK